MKKLKCFVFGAACILSANLVSAQALEEGNMLVEGYYGFPNLYTSVFKAAYSTGFESNLEVGSIGPLGGRFEYMMSDKFGIGLDVGYSQSSITFTEEGSLSTTRYEYDFTTSKLGFMVTFNYHFDFVPDNMDLALGLGAGYGSRKFEFTSNEPGYQRTDIESIIPIASRLGATFRYFFTDNIGANVGIGIGQGGLLNAGISVKL